MGKESGQAVATTQDSRQHRLLPALFAHDARRTEPAENGVCNANGNQVCLCAVKEREKERGLSRIIAAFRAPLLRYAARMLGNTTMAQDAVQNTWVKLARREPPLQALDDETRNWLFLVVHNEGLNLVRAEERRGRIHAAYAAEQETMALPDTGTEEREATVLSCLPVLPPLQRQIVLLRLQQGLSYDDIAAIVGETTSNVGSLLHRAIKTLAAEVKRHNGEDNVPV